MCIQSSNSVTCNISNFLLMESVQRKSISFPEPTCRLVSTKTQSLGADQKARGLWVRD